LRNTPSRKRMGYHLRIGRSRHSLIFSTTRPVIRETQPGEYFPSESFQGSGNTSFRATSLIHGCSEFVQGVKGFSGVRGRRDGIPFPGFEEWKDRQWSQVEFRGPSRSLPVLLFFTEGFPLQEGNLFQNLFYLSSPFSSRMVLNILLLSFFGGRI